MQLSIIITVIYVGQLKVINTSSDILHYYLTRFKVNVR